MTKADKMFEELGYKLNYFNGVYKYEMPWFGGVCTIKIWTSENDTYVDKYTSLNNEHIRMSPKECLAIWEKLREIGEIGVWEND